jgi:Ca-activated chloride channel family protein
MKLTGDRAPNPEPQPGKPFGLMAWLEETKISLPLKGVECRFDVCGDLLDVQMDQIYRQSADRPLDCIYSFPLPTGAAVYRCEMHVNDRVVRAKIEAEEKAREIYINRLAEGRRAALVETVRDNFFTLSLGNLQPGDVLVVRFAYFQTLTRLGDEISLQIPVCPGVRYIPGKPLLRSLSGRGTVDDTDQVPDASRISPPRIDALDPDAAYFFLEGKIERTVAQTETISSPSHPVMAENGNGETVHVWIAQKDAVPDRDFVLRWTEPKENTLQPLAWSHRANGETYAFVQLRAPEVKQRAKDFEQDVYFLLDRSGSMAGAKWEKTCEALHAFVNILGKKDRAWITLFESAFRDFAEKPLPPTKLQQDGAFQNIVKLGAGGGTEMLPALQHVLKQIAAHSGERKTSIVLITDGQVGNEQAVLEALRPCAELALHAFGIDTAVNDAFLKNLAGQQRGQCILLTPNDDIAGTVAKLADRMRRPVLTHIRVENSWETATETPMRESIADLYSSEVIDIPLLATGENVSSVKVSGLLPDGKTRRFTFDPIPVKNQAVKLLWARKRIETLLGLNRMDEAVAIAKANNLLCRGASFVAWDEAEKVAISDQTVYQPNIMVRSIEGYRASVAAKYSFLAQREQQRFSGGSGPTMFCHIANPDPPVSDLFRERTERARSHPRFQAIIDYYNHRWPKLPNIACLSNARELARAMRTALPFDWPHNDQIFHVFAYWASCDETDIDQCKARWHLLENLCWKLKTHRAEADTILEQFIQSHLKGQILEDAMILLGKARVP